MPLGSANPLPPVNVGDTVEIYAALRIDEQPLTPDQIAGVTFTVQRPDGTQVNNLVGNIESDGRGFYRWTDTTQTGVYRTQAQFTLATGEIRSVILTFSVVNPFADEPAPTPIQLVTQAVWMRLEDLFDSVAGGPWLREQTMYNFDENKIAQFVPEALLDINVQMPPTQYPLDFFTTWTTTPGDNPNMPILVKATLVLVVRHLMRSYVEQPRPQGGQVVWHDRTQYTQMWGQVYQYELADFKEALRLWKRTTLNLGRSSMSVLSKAGRLAPYGSRTQNAHRGYY